MRRPIYLFFLGIFSIITIVGCTNNEVEISKIIKEEIEKQPLSELDTNISRWKANKLSNYQFDFQWFCFCEPDYISPVTITVEDDVISHVMYSATKIQVQEDKRSRYKTIDDLFSFVQDADNQNAHQISIHYDLHRGYPIKGSVDYVEMIADDEKGFEIKNLMELETNEDGTWLIERLPINEILLQINKNIPPSINISVEGYLTDSCTLFHQIKQKQKENLVTVEITTKRPRDAVCAEVITEISKSIQLKANFLIGQDYILVVNDKEKHIDL